LGIWERAARGPLSVRVRCSHSLICYCTLHPSNLPWIRLTYLFAMPILDACRVFESLNAIIMPCPWHSPLTGSAGPFCGSHRFYFLIVVLVLVLLINALYSSSSCTYPIPRLSYYMLFFFASALETRQSRNLACLFGPTVFS
jgi:hypothetical protein